MLKAEHAFLWGDSGSGKTTVLREIHDEVDAPSIYCKHDYAGEENRDDGFRGFEVGGPEGMRTAASNYSEWSDVRICYAASGKSAQTAVAECIQFAREVPVPCQVVVDELDEVMPNDDSTTAENAAKWAYRKGRDEGVKIVGATQTPQGLDHTALRSCRWWCAVGLPSGLNERFYQRHQWIPREELPDRDLHYVVLNKQGEVVYRGVTKQEYA